MEGEGTENDLQMKVFLVHFIVANSKDVHLQLQNQ